MKSPAMFCYVIQSEVEEIPIGVISFQGMTPFTKNQIKDIKSASIDIESFANSMNIDMKIGSDNAKPPEGM